jgi:hypothetical protein
MRPGSVLEYLAGNGLLDLSGRSLSVCVGFQFVR